MERRTQIEITSRIKKAASELTGEGEEYFQSAVDYIKNKIDHREYDEDAVEHERSIRWRRTADQILKDGYVYKQKGCTDRVILFQALCETKGYNTNFVKVRERDGRAIHSVAEVEVPSVGWFTVDVGGGAGIKKGKLGKDEEFGRWTFWKRGKDAWDLGFTSNYEQKN